MFRPNQLFSWFPSSVVIKFFDRFAFLILLMIGGAFRLYHATTLSLWFDEGVSLYLARLPWSTILGHIEQYDTHPPLYPLLLKFLTTVLSEATAVWLFSVALGTLTIPVVYALAQRLFGTRAAFVAAAALAVNPLHIWYSQEGRPYVGVVFLVACSTLALVAYHQERRPRWAALYTLATLAALYFDYSAFYALAPQAAFFAYIAWVHRRRAWPIFLAAVGVALGYLPWLPRMVGTVSGMNQERAPALGVTPTSVGGTILSLVGLGGDNRYVLSSQPLPWHRWPDAHLLLLLLLVLVVGVAGLALGRGRAPALLVTGGLLGGTLLIGAAVSLYRPGFAERTVLAATLGWALLLGALVTGRLPRPVRLLGGVGALGVLLLSASSLGALYAGGDKDHWRDLAADWAALAKGGQPLITFHVISPVLLDVYAPHLLDTGHINIGQFQDLPPLPADWPSGARWLAYIELAGIEQVRAGLVTGSYTRQLHISYSEHSLNPIYLDLYARPGLSFLREVPINGLFAGGSNTATGWDLPAQGVQLSAGSAGGRVLTLTNPAPGESRAALTIPATRAIYSLSFAARAQLSAGRVRSFLLCAAGDGHVTRVDPDGAGADVPHDGAWHAVQIDTFCPADTGAVVADLRNAGSGTVDFQDVRLRTLPLFTGPLGAGVP